MNIDYKHPEFAVWHLAESPVKLIPYGALVKWFDQVIQFGFHLGDGIIAWRDGLISALDTDPRLPWKRKTCVLAQDGRPVVFWQQTLRSEFQVGLYHSRQDFISGCLGEDLADWGNFPRLDLRPFREMFSASGRPQCRIWKNLPRIGIYAKKLTKTISYDGKCRIASLILPGNHQF